MAFSKRVPRVLCVGRDPRLLETRQLVLAKRYETVTVGSIEEMRALPIEEEFDVVVLCHSLSFEECDLSSELARGRWRHAKIVALSIQQGDCSVAADQTVRALDGPRFLLRTIDQVVAA
ncbi:MAG TPA: hypothetical protein VGF82_14610 [Terracidiphilus sp.]|jgi:hypothetical protein